MRWPIYKSVSAALMIWLLALSPHLIFLLVMGSDVRRLPEFVAAVPSIMLILGQGFWAAAWVLSCGLRRNGPDPKLLQRSFIWSGAAMGAGAVVMQILYIPFTPDPLGYNRLGYLFLPPLIPIAAAICGLYGFVIHRVWLVIASSWKHGSQRS